MARAREDRVVLLLQFDTPHQDLLPSILHALQHTSGCSVNQLSPGSCLEVSVQLPQSQQQQQQAALRSSAEAVLWGVAWLEQNAQVSSSQPRHCTTNLFGTRMHHHEDALSAGDRRAAARLGACWSQRRQCASERPAADPPCAEVCVCVSVCCRIQLHQINTALKWRHWQQPMQSASHLVGVHAAAAATVSSLVCRWTHFSPFIIAQVWHPDSHLPTA